MLIALVLLVCAAPACAQNAKCPLHGQLSRLDKLITRADVGGSSQLQLLAKARHKLGKLTASSKYNKHSSDSAMVVALRFINARLLAQEPSAPVTRLDEAIAVVTDLRGRGTQDPLARCIAAYGITLDMADSLALRLNQRVREFPDTTALNVELPNGAVAPLDTCTRNAHSIHRRYDLAMSRERDPALRQLMSRLQAYETSQVCGRREAEVARGIGLSAFAVGLDKAQFAVLASQYPVQNAVLQEVLDRWYTSSTPNPSLRILDWNKIAAQDRSAIVQGLEEVSSTVPDTAVANFISELMAYNTLELCDRARADIKVKLLSEFATLHNNGKGAASAKLHELNLNLVSLSENVLAIMDPKDCWPVGAQMPLDRRIRFATLYEWIARGGADLRDGPRADIAIDISDEDGLLISDLVDLYHLGDYPSAREYIARKIVVYNLTAHPGVELVANVKERHPFRSPVLSRKVSVGVEYFILPSLANMGLNFIQADKDQVYTYDPSAAQ